MEMRNQQHRATTIEDLRQNRVSDATKKSYRSALNQVKIWIQSYGTPDMLDQEGEINLRVFEYRNFLQFIEWTVQFTNNKVGTLSNYRSAIKDPYKRNCIPFPDEYDIDMKELLQGFLIDNYIIY